MSQAIGDWLVRSAAGGALVLLATSILIACSGQPARRQRLAECGVLASLLVGILCIAPGWIHLPGLIPVPSISEPRSGLEHDAPVTTALSSSQETAPQQEQATPNLLLMVVPEQFGWSVPDGVDPRVNWGEGEVRMNDSLPPATEVTSTGIVATTDGAIEPIHGIRRSPWQLIGMVYALCSAALLGRWLVGQWLLKRLIRSARPAPGVVRQQMAALKLGGARLPRLLVSERVSMPFSCGILHPTIVLPKSFLEPESADVLRWVLLHELSHLDRGDPWSCQLLGLAQACYFHVPWFWWLRKQVRLSQEFLADAEVARRFGEVEDYAQFLVNLGRKQVAPLGAQGVVGKNSDLFRRIAMLLDNRNRVENRCPRWCSLTAAGGFAALAIILAGINLRADASNNMLSPGAASSSKAIDPNQQDKSDLPQPPDHPTAPNVPPVAVVVPIPADHDAPLPPPQPGQSFPPPRAPRPDQSLTPVPGAPQALHAWQEAESNNWLTPYQVGQPSPGGAAYLFGGAVHGRLGITISKPSDALVDQLNLPKGQGIVVEEIMPDSPAAKAGFKKHDILIELKGKKVTSDPQALTRMIQRIEEDTKFDAVVLRKGKKATIRDISLPEEKEGAGVLFAPEAGALWKAAPGMSGGFGFGRGTGMGGMGMPGQPLAWGMMSGRHDVMTTTTRTNDRFTTRYQEGSLVITITGKVSEGKAKVGKIHVQDGRESHSYESVSNVPEEYRDKVANLVEMSETGNLRIKISTKEGKQPTKKKKKPEPKDDDDKKEAESNDDGEKKEAEPKDKD